MRGKMLRNLLFVAAVVFTTACANNSESVNSAKPSKLGSEIKAGDKIITQANFGTGGYTLALVREIDVEKDSAKLSYVRNDKTVSDETKNFRIDQIYPLALARDCGSTTLGDSRQVVYQESPASPTAPAVFWHLEGVEENGKIKFIAVFNDAGRLLTDKQKENWKPPIVWCNVIKSKVAGRE